jgi:hemerythrin-like domain-containing protein
MAQISPVVNGLVKIHKLITRALSVSVVKCDEYLNKNEIPGEELQGFRMYLITLVRVMHSHHSGEDDIVFPYCIGRIDAPYEKLKDEHVSMSKMLDDLESRLDNISIGALPLLREKLDRIQRYWEPHIKSEELSFTDEILAGKMTGKEQKDLVDQIGRHGAKSSGPGPITIPFIIYNLQPGDRKEFIEDFPWIIKNFLVPIVWRSKWKAMDPFLLN